MISAQLITLCAALTLLAACGRQAPAPVPRPTAYPRVAAYDSVYSAVDSIALHFEANSAEEAQAKAAAEVPDADYTMVQGSWVA